MAVEIACRSLAAVSQNQPGEPVFQALRITQLHVTLANLQRLDQVKLSPIQANRLLSATWDALRDYLIPDVNRMDDYTSSHRLAMRSLIYALKIQVRRQDSTGDQRKLKEKRATLESDSPGLIGSQIIDQVILRAVKSTIIALHEDQPATLTEELALATVILQNAAKLQGLGQYYTEISMTAISEDVLRTLANLFSWSRQIKKDDFPLFGQYCSRLLLEFSRIPQLAEQMAIQGILGLLANASILGAIRQGTSAVQMPKLFSIWVDDILPILLNVLSSVGKPVAQEVASFLNQFQARLEGSKNLWRDPEKITRSQVKESHLLILLGKIFETFDCGKALALDLDVQELTSGMIFLLEGRKSGLKGRVVPTNEEELAMARTDGSGGMNKLETLVCNELLEMRVLALGSEGVREESVRRNTRGGSLRP